MTNTGHLLVVNPDGTAEFIGLGYEPLRRAVGDVAFDFARVTRSEGFYVRDEGMFDGSDLNIPATVFGGRPLWGPCVLCAAYPDDNGDTLPASASAVEALGGLAARWRDCIAAAALVGQDIVVHPATPATIPEPVIMTFDSQEEFDAFLATGEVPS